MEAAQQPAPENRALQQLLAADGAAGPAPDGEALRKLRSLTSAVVAGAKGQALDAAQRRELRAGASALWNRSLDLQNAGGASALRLATGRQCASDLFSVSWSDDLPVRESIDVAGTHLKTGEAWAELGEREAATAAFSRALEFAPLLKEASIERQAWGLRELESGTLLFQATLAAMDNALHLNQQASASELQRRATALATHPRVPAREGAALRLELVKALQAHGRRLLLVARDGEAIPLLDGAYELLASLQGDDEEGGGAAELSPEDRAGMQRLVGSVLLLLAHAYSTSPGNEQRARNCAEALRQLDLAGGEGGGSGGGQGGVQGGGVAASLFLAQALLRGGSPAEAEAEVLDLFNHEDATPDMCADVIGSMLGTDAGVAIARSALSVALSRFPDDASISYGVLRRALDAGKEGAGADAEALVLEVLGDDRVCEALCEDAVMAAEARGLVWNHAVRRQQEGACEGALQFFEASQRLAEQAGDAGAGAQGLCAQALCCLALGRHDRAQQCLDEAERAEEGRPATAFLRLQVLLGAGDAEGAAAAVAALAACAGSQAMGLVKMACLEALDAGAPSVAAQALRLLLERVAAAGDGAGGGTDGAAAPPPGYEASLFQNLISLTLEEAVRKPAPASAAPAAEAAGAVEAPMLDGGGQVAEGGGAGAAGAAAKPATGSSPDDATAELARLFDCLLDRLKAVGAEALFDLAAGTGGGRPTQLEWLAGAAWNGACAAAQRGRREDAAVLMGAAGELGAAHPAPTAAVLSRRKMSFLMAAALTADVHAASPDFPAALHLARRYLAAAQAAQAAQAAAAKPGEAPPADKQDVYLLMTEFSLASQSGDVPAQLAAVSRAAAMPALTADHLAKMAAMAGQAGPNRSAQVCVAAQRAALQALTAQAAPNYVAIAAVLRALLELCNTDEERLQLLGEASGLLDAAPQGSFPALEVQWLVVKAWNLGALRRKFEGGGSGGGAAAPGGKVAPGTAYQRVAVALLRHCPALQSKKEMMEGELRKAESAGEEAGKEGSAAEADVEMA